MHCCVRVSRHTFSLRKVHLGKLVYTTKYGKIIFAKSVLLYTKYE